MDTITFLNLIFADGLTEDQRLVIWSAPDKAREFFADAEAAVEYAQTKADTQNVYFGLGLIHGNPKGRGKLADVAAIGCLWADIDIAGEGHKKTNLPADLSAARRLLDRVGLKPSIIIHSGHGLQAYWLLKELWTFEDAPERHKAATLARRWVATIRAVAGVEGYDVDAVGDLTRVFRLPGTMNRKGEPIPVKIIEDDPALRYGADDFDQFLVAEEFEPDTGRASVDPIILTKHVNLPTLKLMALLENDIKFKKSWKHNRPDLQDQSPSAYDMSLATIAATSGWTDQEIADLIVAFRQQYNLEPEKVARRSYLQLTIGKAKAASVEEKAIKTLTKTAERLAGNKDTSHQKDSSNPQGRKEFLQNLSSILGVRIQKWVQSGLENAKYSLLLKNGQWIRMGGASDILNARSFRAKLYEATKHLMKPLKGVAWDNICKCLASIVEVLELEEASSAYQAGEWVESYLTFNPAVTQEGWQEAVSVSGSFVKDGQIHIHVGELRKHVQTILREKMTVSELYECLRLSGFSRTPVSAWFEGKTISKSYWSKQWSEPKSSPNQLREKKKKTETQKV